MAEAVLEIVLGNLSSLIGKDLALFLGFDQDLERLASLLITIKATLEDAEEKQFSDRSIKIWLQKLKDAAHVLDDILDECAYEALGLEYQGVKCDLSDKVRCSCLSSFHPKHVVFHHKIAKKMKRISERLEEIAGERTKFHLAEMIPQRRSEVIEWRQTTSSIMEPQVYGREEDTDKIVDFLIGDADASHVEDLSVYPIVGLGGLGKTTLAQLIFNHERVVNHFELRIWVCVSEDFSLKRMTKAIIEAESGHACEDLDLEPLKRRVLDLLQRKRYLLVLDDVWDDEQENWQRLKSVLACGAKGASVLVSTRLPTVASIMGTMPPYELSVLSENDCWELFKYRAFGLNEVEQVELVAIGKDIVKKCGGVPLAANALGGLLRFKREKKEWLNVKESNLLELSHNENSIMSVLRLSYLNLPIKLRQCFAYCAIFPKDEKIEKQYLIDLWMVNGFISSNKRLDAEDVGHSVWNELCWRSFFQDIETDEFGNFTSFKMHDLVHDLAQSVAEDVCCITDDNDVTTLPEKIRHLSDIIEEAINPIQLHKVKSLRTYIGCRFTGQLCPHVLKCYSLRVLHCERRKELSSSIGELKHLRYLNLSRGAFETLPESLCKLWNLQILKLDDCGSLQKLPNSLIRLKALQQLSLNGCNSLSSLPPQIGKLTSLKILSKYFVGKESGFLLAELGPLKLKGVLQIKHLERVKSVKDAKEANMSSKQLNNLTLSWDRNDEEWELQENVKEILEVLQPDTQQLESLRVEEYKGAHFPQWMSSSPSLKRMSLSYLPNLIRLPREDGENMFPSLSTLEIIECHKLSLQGLHSLKDLCVEGCCKFNMSAGFPCLKYLRIERCLEVEITECHKLSLQGLHSLEDLHVKGCCKFNVSAGFPCLKNLRIQRCIEVEGLHKALQHMTALKKLYLLELPNLESLPDCFENLPLLQELILYSLPKLESLPDCFGNLSLLQSLRLESLPKLESLPDCFGNLPLLQSLRLYSLPKLESLPGCFGNLPLLRRLRIFNCPKLRCLPTSLSLTSSLKLLEIHRCSPELEKRCEKETGEDWPKIAHIPDIHVDCC